MSKRIFAILLAAVIMASLCITVTSCKKKKCEHTYESQWSYDENNHWRAATCEHKSETKSFGAHIDSDLDGKCDFCAYYMGIPEDDGDDNQGGNTPGDDNQGGDTPDAECEHQYYNPCDADCNKCGATRIPAAHVYDNNCDASCNVCGATRIPAAHAYDNNCDASCNVCGATRTPAAHVYDNACDTDCNECGDVRVPSNHYFDNACDADCNECGEEREVAAHNFKTWIVITPATTTSEGVKKSNCSECGFEKTESIPKLDPSNPDKCEHSYDNACDKNCNKCGEVRVTEHVYSNACDASCNVCGATRTPAAHVYDNACDASCNVCLTTRTPSAHVYDNNCDASCNVCGATRTPAAHVYDNACDENCNVCNEKRQVNGHSYGAWKTVKEPTTTESGLKKATCTECGFEKTESIPKLNPSNPDSSGNNDGGITDSNWDSNFGTNGSTGGDNTGDDNTGDDNTGSGGTGGSGAYVPAVPSVDSSTQSKLDQLDKDRESYHSTAISGISSYLGGSDAVEALKKIYALFDSDYYLLMAHLFDPGVGGFYYSISARDSVGFLPDLESSRQILNMVNTSGLASAYGDDWTNLFSAEEKALIAKFVQDMKAADGYYYHPQWGTSISTSRRSRDLTSATFILNSLGMLESTASLELYASSPSNLTLRLDGNAASAISRVVAASTTPSHLSSESAFRAYMEEREATMKSNSYSIGNTLSAQTGEINAAGLHSVLIEYLNKWQFDNGLWEDSVSYNSINGLMKISMMYTTTDLKNNLTKTKAALNSLMNFLLDEIDEDGNLTDEALAAVEGITFIYNPWVSMAKLAGALTGTDETNFNSQLKANAANLINGTYKKLCVFEKNDGGFSYQPKSSSYQSQGEIVALRGVAESDVNATTIAAGMVVGHILPAFGVPTDKMPKLFTEEDSKMFYELLDARTPVEKVVVIGTPVRVTFDAYEESEGDTEGGVLLYPDYSVITNVGDNDMENGKYIWFQSGIVKNPAAGKTDNVLYAESFIRDTNGDGEYKSTSDSKEMAPSGYSSSTDFSIVNYAASGNTYVFETDIYVSPTKTGTVAELYFVNSNNGDQSAKLQLNAYTSGSTTYLKIVEANYFYGSNGNDSTVADKIAVNSWVKLRFELTKTYDAGGKVSAMLMSIYVNGTLAKTFETGSYSSTDGYRDYVINAFRFSYFRSANTKFYFNNAYATKITK